MGRRTWNERSKEIRRKLSVLSKLSDDDPTLSDKRSEALREMRQLMDEEDVPGQPEWIRLQQIREQQRRGLQTTAPPVLAAVREAIERETGTAWGDRLRLGCNLDLTFVGFDVWYELDEELEYDRVSGRCAELTSIMKRAARDVANLESEVRFHSHQFVLEKCGGDYFNYLR